MIRVPVTQTKQELYDMFNLWPEGELMAITQVKNMYQTAEVTFQFKGETVRVMNGHEDSYAENLRKIYLTLKGIQLAYYRGLGDILTGTVSQMLQLGAAAKTRDPYEVLGVRPDAAMEDIDDMYKIKAKRAHPDAGGSHEAMAELNAAIERIRAERSVSA